ncbi:MAG: hypothetical protein B9S32_08115 [Verrucomicrobia bacterium Tous-C9LFEB]|nr:MAG: hypothetical protein B9S32_08115 [Verrucomicrobia bacterium Tous-C9LFEB]
MSSLSHLEEKIRAGWLGKVIGGTLGGPFEGYAGKLNVPFYDPIPSQALPNDDLDLQVVWLRYLLSKKVTSVQPADLADAWQKHVGFPWCEYAVGLRNRHYGLSGVQLGAFDNWFADCMGAAIRSEIWAFLAPSDTRRAAHYAWADAIFDHAGDGVYAAMFFAVLESSAFEDSDLNSLIEKGLAAIPAASRTAFAVRRTQYLWSLIRNWEEVREILIVDLAPTHFTDTAINIAFTILGLLAGERDFERTLCIANNCGWDTDCTAATAGAILGVMDPSCIPPKWSDPIGGKVLLNPQILDMPLETSLDELTEQTLQLRAQLTHHIVGDTIVLPRMRPRPSESPIQIPYRCGIQEQSIKSVTTLTDIPAESFTAAGHWFRHSVSDPKAKAMHFSFNVKIDDERPVRFMAFLSRPCRTFVDGKSYADFEPRSWAPGWHGPSFHLFAERAVDGTKPLRAPALVLTPGEHRFDVLLEHDGTDAIELVIGVADATSDLWLPFALAIAK